MADDISAWQQFFEFSDFSCQFTVKFKKRHLRIWNGPEQSDKAGNNCEQHDRYKAQLQNKIAEPVALHQITAFTSEIYGTGLRIVNIKRSYQCKIQADYNGADYSGKNQQASDNDAKGSIKNG